MRFLSGHIRQYDVFLTDDVVAVIDEKELITKKQVSGLAAFLRNATDVRLGWGQLPDSEVIYIYDRDDDNFGYAVNLHAPDLSEWGYAPFT